MQKTGSIAKKGLMTAQIDSPCIKTCRIDQASGLCIGCLRNLDEIAGWAGFSADKRRILLKALPFRRARIAENS